MRVSELTRQKPTATTIELGDDDTIALVFDRNRITPAWIEAAEERDKAQDVLSLPKMLADAVLSWDVFQESEGDFPPTAANISVLSFHAQTTLLRGITTAAVPSRAEGNDSSAPTSTLPSDSREPAPTSQNGQPPSPLPAPSASPSPT